MQGYDSNLTKRYSTSLITTIVKGIPNVLKAIEIILPIFVTG